MRVNRTKEIEMTGEESMYLYVSDDTESLDERMKGVSELSWRRELVEGRKVNDQIMKGKNCYSLLSKLSMKAKETFIHILLMKYSF